MSADLFTSTAEEILTSRGPLADRLRPRTLDEVVGQTHLIGPGKPLRALANTRRRKQIRDDDIRAFGHPIHHATVIITVTPQDKLVVEPTRLRRACCIAGPLQYEGVMPVGGVRIRRVEPLMNHERQIDAIGRPNRGAQGPVLIQAMRGLHPVQHVLPVRSVPLAVQVDRPRDQLVAHIVTVLVMP